jgi:arylsulfatase A-like enzyme
VVEGDCTELGRYTERDYGGYEDALFAREVMRTVAQHDAASPYFLFWAPHIAHVPLQVPKEYYDKFSHLEDGDGSPGRVCH